MLPLIAPPEAKEWGFALVISNGCLIGARVSGHFNVPKYQSEPTVIVICTCAAATVINLEKHTSALLYDGQLAIANHFSLDSFMLPPRGSTRVMKKLFYVLQKGLLI